MRKRQQKPVRIELGKDVSDPAAAVAKLGMVVRTIKALQAEADWLMNRITDGLIAEGSITPKDLAWINTLVARGEHRAAAEYFRGRMAAQD
jgi:hypothetical protein